MAKKNKKFIKINQKIKKYFDNEAFDVAIERVESSTLSELMHYLGIYDIEYTKPVMLKTIRHLWSNADVSIREHILDFFIQNKKIYKSDKQKESLVNKTEKIISYLDELEANEEEKSLVLEAFKEMKTKKITFSKVKNTLEYLRFEEKRLFIEKACNGTFDLDNCFEFYANLTYKIFDEVFQKTNLLKTKPYKLSYLKETQTQEIIEKINQDKEEAKQQKQLQLDNFLNSIKIPHKYLQKSQIIHAIKSSKQNIELIYPPLKTSIIKKIISNFVEVTDVSIESDELYFKTNQSLVLPITNEKITYELEVFCNLNNFLKNVYLSNDLNLKEHIIQAKNNLENAFLNDIRNIIEQCKNYTSTLNLEKEKLYKLVYDVFVPYIPIDLRISSKLIKKTVKRFIYSIQELIIKQQKQQLLAQSIRDFKNLFPLARNLRRKLILHIGPTNSGKTYTAMQKLKEADTGYYLAPLRLLALEGYENLKESNINASLITGEEQILDEEATHVSSTIEMLNYDVDVDVCVIDEVQLIDDRDRGWAWANAIIGAPAKEVIMTGSPASKEAIVKLAKYLGEELEIVEFERKNPLNLLPYPISLKDVKKGTALIAFSRKEVLKLKQKLSAFFKTSIIYGNLSPEVRKEEARRFREGESEIVIATDAISMGLNLPIKTIVFTKAKKFDGITERELTPNEIKQISGRAGRYGLQEQGYVTASSKEVLKIIKKNFNKPDIEISMPFKVMANIEHVKLISNILEETSLKTILEFFSQNMTFSGPFVASNIEDMLEIAAIVDNYDLDIVTKFHLSTAPITLSSNYILGVFESYLQHLQAKKQIPYNPPKLQTNYARTNQELLHVEDMVKEISLYLWLSYRFEEYFIQPQKARQYRAVLNDYIEKSLQQDGFAKTCKICSKVIPKSSDHRICDGCFKKYYKKSYKPRRR